METRLIREFEELEGLAEQFVEDTSVTDDKDDDDPSQKPAMASSLQNPEIYMEVIIFQRTA